MKCRTCRGPAVIDVRRHNAAFCRDHFLHHCEEQVRRAISSHRMIGPDERVLVAVSGGKDSLALWDLLVRLGYVKSRLVFSGESTSARAGSLVGDFHRLGRARSLDEMASEIDRVTLARTW